MYPLLQIQSVTLLLPCPEYVLLGQLLHVASEICAVSVEYLPDEHKLQGAEPLTSLYVPATHASHGPPSAPVKPKLHLQSTSSSLDASEIEPDGQPEQLCWPLTFLYVPDTQAVHSVPSAPL